MHGFLYRSRRKRNGEVAKASQFFNKGKTERECVAEIVKEAEAAGYESLEED